MVDFKTIIVFNFLKIYVSAFLYQSNQLLIFLQPSPPVKPKPANIEAKALKSSPVLTPKIPKYVESVKQSFNNDKETVNDAIKKNPSSPSVRRPVRTFGSEFEC